MTAANGTRPATGGRVPPHDLTAEESLLGAMLLSRDAITAAAGLAPDDFYKPAHGHIHQAIVDLHTEGEPADPVTVADRLTRSGLLAQAGGAIALVELQNATPAISNAARYARIVSDHALLRRLTAAAGEIAELGYSQPADVETAADRAEHILHTVTDSRRRAADRLIPAADLAARYLERLERLYEADRGAVTGIPTGLIDLDHVTAGMHPGELVIICARPSVGKSAVGTGIAYNAARAGHPALMVSIEMSEEEIAGRWLAAAARVHLTHLRTGQLTDNDWQRVGTHIGHLADVPLWLADDPDAGLASIGAAARRVPGLELLVVDYLQLMRATERAENRQNEVAALSAGLKRLGRDLRIPVVALAQLSRNLEYRADKRPILADLRDSGALEQDADVVIGLYRDEVYKPDSSDRGVMELIVLKQRNGPTTTVRVSYMPEHNLIANMAKAI